MNIDLRQFKKHVVDHLELLRSLESKVAMSVYHQHARQNEDLCELSLSSHKKDE